MLVVSQIKGKHEAKEEHIQKYLAQSPAWKKSFENSKLHKSHSQKQRSRRLEQVILGSIQPYLEKGSSGSIAKK